MSHRFRRLSIKWSVIILLVILGLSSIFAAEATGNPSASPAAVAVPTSIYDFELTGITDFPNVYTGGVRELDGSVTFYVTKRDPALLTAIAAADTDGTPYRFAIVPYSSAETNAMTMAIAKQNDALSTDGVRLVEWGPNPRTGMVVVHLATPTDNDLAKLASANRVPLSSVTVTSYPKQVETLLRARFGAGVQVDPTYEEPAQAADRKRSASPFSDDDTIVRSRADGCIG